MSTQPAPPEPAIPTVPVICDKCRTTGFAGDEAFSAIPDILNFTPVQRRAHVNGWREEHQRAFIAALAITGSPRQAARAIGRHAFGAEQLRTHRGGKGFAAAWDAAIELARERETHRIHDNLGELAAEREAELARISPPRGEGLGEGLSRVGPIHPDCDYDPDLHTDDYPEYWQARQQVRERMLKARRLLLMLLSTDPAKRAAWETLCGPVNWAQAANNEAEDGEAYACPEQGRGAMQSARDADVMICAEVGFLSEMTGGPDVMTELVTEALRLKMIESAESESTERSDAGASAAGAARRDAEPVRPGCGRAAADCFDVTDSLRDGPPSTS